MVSPSLDTNTLFPVLVVYVAPLLYIQVIYDQTVALEVQMQCFLLKYFFIYLSIPNSGSCNAIVLFIDLGYDNILDSTNIKIYFVWLCFLFKRPNLGLL